MKMLFPVKEVNLTKEPLVEFQTAIASSLLQEKAPFAARLALLAGAVNVHSTNSGAGRSTSVLPHETVAKTTPKNIINLFIAITNLHLWETYPPPRSHTPTGLSALHIQQRSLPPELHIIIVSSY